MRMQINVLRCRANILRTNDKKEERTKNMHVHNDKLEKYFQLQGDNVNRF